MQGQASTDYAAVLLVVLAVVTGTFAWADGHALADGVAHAVARALCIARAGDCDVDALPCITASDETRTEATLKLAFIRLDARTVLLRQTRSDGTVFITKGRLAGTGPIGGAGTEVKLVAGRVRVRYGASAELSVTGIFERSRTWIAHGTAAADRIVAQLKGHAGGLPPPDITTDRHGLTTALEATFARRRIGALLGLSAQSVQEVRRDDTTGRRTLWLEHRATGSVSLTLAQIGAGAEGSVLERYGVTLDRDGRPVDLVVLRQGSLQGSAALPRRLQSVAGLLSTPTKGGRIWAQETHLDLTEPENLALAHNFLSQVSDPSALRLVERVAVSRALAERLDAVGVEHVRTMAVDETKMIAGGSTGVGFRWGGELSRTTLHQRILDAATRGIDGVWRRRADCVRSA